MTPSLLTTIRALGGIELREIRDCSGERRAGRGVKGMPVALFRQGGRTLDDLATELRDEGYAINTDDVDGGIGQLRDLIRDEIGGEKTYTIEREMEMYEQESASYNDIPDFIPHAPHGWSYEL